MDLSFKPVQQWGLELAFAHPKRKPHHITHRVCFGLAFSLHCALAVALQDRSHLEQPAITCTELLALIADALYLHQQTPKRIT